MKKVSFFFEDIPSFKIDRKEVRKFIGDLIREESGEQGEISIIFCSDPYLLRMNIQYLEHDYYTDIITFNYVENRIISGDLFISTDRVKANAVEYNIPFMEELYRVIIHGVLHLTGYNDKSFHEKKVMREKENYYLEKQDIDVRSDDSGI